MDFLRLSLILTSYAVLLVQGVSIRDGSSTSSEACATLAKLFPSNVFFPGSTQYASDILHYAESSAQNSTCSVEPQTVDDVGTILKTVGAQNARVPFAIKSGGHTSNANFSSTPGVQISMAAFHDVAYDASTSSVKIGTGQTWIDVYNVLEPMNLTVVGGRVQVVGVGGLILGGGFSWLTDQYGLAVDNMIAFDLVLPNGTFVEVTNSSDPDLFFALKGGFNNYGIVTSFTMQAYPQGNVWGGVIIFDPNNTEVVNLVYAATSNFSFNNTDPKAQMIMAYSITGTGEAAIAAFLFYDAPTQPDAFESFLTIPSLSSDLQVRNFTALLDAMFGPSTTDPQPYRETEHPVPILKYTTTILETIKEQMDSLYAQAVADQRAVGDLVFSAEPFTGAFDHSTESAYPHPSDRQVTPATANLFYVNAEDDEYFENALKAMVKAVQTVAVNEGQSSWSDLYYPNYALPDTPLELMYGDNVGRLRSIRERVDPKNVMTLTGGFKFI